jgi:cobalt-zinc-cadmium efflux system protein
VRSIEKKHMRESATSRLFEFQLVEKKRLILSLSITLIVMVVEFIGGFLTYSIALISDAGHMFTHAFALGLSLLAIIIASKPACNHKTFGLYRAEVLAAFLNGIFLLLIVGFIVFEAIERFLNPEEVLSLYMLIIAILGLVVNVASIFILQGFRKSNMGIKSVFYHMIADAASSIGIIIAAIVISFTNWNFLDPLVSLGISAVIVYWAWGILRDSTRILLEMTPKGLDIDSITEDLKKKFSIISEVFHVHIWTITPEMLVLSAHLKLNACESPKEQEGLILEVRKYLHEKYNIFESTFQTVCNADMLTCNF